MKSWYPTGYPFRATWEEREASWLSAHTRHRGRGNAFYIINVAHN
jgi:hypothetical protein